MDRLTHAKFFATVKHSGQLYGAVLPYTHHLQDVEQVLREHGESNEDLLVAAWCHDMVEDTETKVREIEECFGEEVARLVEAVTDEPGPNRKTRKVMTYPKIREAGAEAVRLKLADRIANIRHNGPGVRMYVREHEEFRRQLYTEGENEDMWKTLGYYVAQAKRELSP